MFRYSTVVLCFTFVAVALYAATKEETRLEKCGVVMEEIMNVPDNVPQGLWNKADCVIVIPSVKKAAMGLGERSGRGAMVCRSGENFNGPWGAPAMYALEGGSLGFQPDREATDLVLLIMTHRGADSILNGKIKLGGDASVAAGPKGGEAQLATDAYMGAEILSYSRSRGLFAGISLQGSTLRPDDEASEQIYGRKITAKDIVLGKEIVIPVTGRHLVHVLQKNAPRNESIQASMRANP
ncbi:MAG: hypothetical protein DMG06_25635 [Acidobacteria bacterium]|nr:MAG: hypothetical protein DMG06_25635 [Acidobacteriota bacterium]